MNRDELSKKFDEAVGQALNLRQWASTGGVRFGLVALAIAVRGLWPDVQTKEAVVDERDFGPPVNQGGG